MQFYDILRLISDCKVVHSAPYGLILILGMRFHGYLGYYLQAYLTDRSKKYLFLSWNLNPIWVEKF